jgi:hypothetical protein
MIVSPARLSFFVAVAAQRAINLHIFCSSTLSGDTASHNGESPPMIPIRFRRNEAVARRDQYDRLSQPGYV